MGARPKGGILPSGLRASRIGDSFCTMRTVCTQVSERPTGARPEGGILPCGLRASRIGVVDTINTTGGQRFRSALILNQPRILRQLQTFTAPQRQSGKNICWQEYFLRERWCHLASIGWTKLTHIQRADRILDTGREADNAFIFLPQNILANPSFHILHAV